MTSSMNGFSEEVAGLVTGAPASTTPSWRAAFARGTVSLDRAGHVWGYAVDLDDTARFNWGSLHDGDDEIQVNITAGSVADPQVDAWTYSGSSITSVSASISTPATPWTDGIATVTLNAGSPGTPGISDDDIDGIEIHLKDGADDVLAKGFFFDTGALVYENAVGGQNQEVVYENTGVLIRHDDGVVLRNTPSLRPPQETGTTADPKRTVFFRVISLDGSASSAGQTSVTLLLDSGGNHARYSKADVERVQIYPAERYMEGWHRLLTDEPAGFPYQAGCSLAGSGTPPACTDTGSQTYLWCDKDGADSCDVDDGSLDALAVSIVHTIVTVEED